MKSAPLVRVVCCALVGICLAPAAFAELSYDYYTGELHAVPDFATLKPESSGTIPNFDYTLGNKAAEENYSIRFSGGLKIAKDGNYTFYTSSDDGSKLWIDDKLVVDNDGDHGADEKSGKAKLAAGTHKIVLGYYQAGGDRALTVSYEGGDIAKVAIPNDALTPKPPATIPPPPTNVAGNLSYEYFEGEFDKLPDFATLTTPAKGECDGFDIALDGRARPENFAIRFTGQIKIDKDGEYTFYTASDDGSRLLIDDKAVVENDGDHPTEEKDGKATLTAGAHKITVLYYQHGGEKALTVSYAGPDIEKRTIPGMKLSK
jgi:hypothetical protein